MLEEFFSNQLIGLFLMPILIFFSRVLDVSLQTLRIIFTTKDRRNLAPIVGFFEVFIWILAMGQIFSNLTNILYYIAYAGGFATGNYTGMLIERKLSLGVVSLQLIVPHTSYNLIEKLKQKGYGSTILKVDDDYEKYKVLVIIIKRKRLHDILELIDKHIENAFYTLQEVQAVSQGMIPAQDRLKFLSKMKTKKK